MHELYREWVEKAEADFATATREWAVSQNAYYDAVCFHAQQCVEKLMKAFLLQREEIVPKTHDLAYLDSLLAKCGMSSGTSSEDLRYLSRAAVEYRYPGESASKEEATHALDVCERLRARLRDLLIKDE